MNRVRNFLMTAALALAGIVTPGLVTPALAQTTMNLTYLNANIDAKQQVIPLTSVTGISASSRNLDGDLIFVNREAMQVNAVDTVAKTVTVRRGYSSSSGSLIYPVGATVHASGTAVWTGPKRSFYFQQAVGACSTANESYLPHIVLPSANDTLGGTIQDCVNSQWTQFKYDGYLMSAGLIDTSSTTSGTTQSTEYTLNSVTIPATDFAMARGVRCQFDGTLAANANAKTLKFYFGSTVVTTLTGDTDNGADFTSEITVYRTGQSTQTAFGSISATTTSKAPAVTTSPTEAEGSAIVIKFTSANTAAAAASGTGKGLYCAWLP